MKKRLSPFHLLQARWAFTYSWRRICAIFFISINFSLTVSAQNIQWDKTIGGNNEDRLYSMQQTRDGGYVVGGTSNSGIIGDKTQASRGNYDYWVVKLKADGTKAWDKTIGGNANDNLTSIQQTRDGGYILGGYSISGKSGDKSEANKGTYDEYYNPTTDYWIVKLNADGTKAWDKTIGGNAQDQLASIIQTQDGGYLLGGTSRSGVSGDKTQANRDTSNFSYNRSDYWIVKLNANGTKAWDKTFGGSSFDNLNAVQQTRDGGYILGGFSYSGISGDKAAINQGDGDYWVIKLNAAGTKVWDKTIGGNKDDRLADIKVTNDGGYIIGGISTSDISGSKTEANLGQNDFWVVKLNTNGTKTWDKTFGSIKDETLTSLQQTSDGGYIVGGSIYLGYNEDKPEYIGGDANFWVLKLQADGTKAWDKTMGGDGYDELQSLQQARDGNYILAGSSDSNISGSKTANSRGGNDYWVIKLENRVPDSVIFETIYDKTIGGADLDNLTAMVPTPDGGYLLGGSSLSDISGDKSQAGKGKEDYWLVKTDNTGKKVWDKVFGGSGEDKLTSIVATPDGGYLLGGHSTSPASGDKTQASKGAADYWVVKIDANGVKVWDKSFGGASDDNLTALLASADGGFLLGGSSASGISGDKSQAGNGSTDYWLIKINASGTKVWDKTYGGSSSDKLAALVATTNGGYLLGGSSASGISGDKSQATRAFEDYWVVRINATGTKVWDKTFGGSKDTYDNSGCNPDGEEDCSIYYYFGKSILSALVATPDGGFLLGGSSNAEKGADKSDPNQKSSNDPEGFDAYLRDYWLVKIDGQGTKIWDKTYGGIRKELERGDGDADVNFIGDSELKSIVATPEGDYVLAGTSNSDKGGDKSEDSRMVDIYSSHRYDYWAVKINGSGNKLWDKTIGGLDNDYLSAILPGTEGSFLLGGTSLSGIGADKNTTNQGKTDYWVVQVKADKIEKPTTAAWDMRYGGAGTDNFTVAIKTSDGGYLSGGYTNSGNSGDKTQNSQGQHDYWIVKSDRNGTKIWDKRYGGSGDDYLNRVIQTKDGGYLLGGSSLSGISSDKSQASQGDRDYWVIKVDVLGNKQWDKRFGGSGYDELEKVIQLASGEYVLGGYSNSPASGDKSQASQGGNDYWLVKISSTGAKLWDKRYGGASHETLGSFTEAKDGGFLLGGTSFSKSGGDKSQANRGGSDYWVVKTDKEGNLLWDKTYGGSGQDEAYSVGRSGSDFFIAGTSNSGISGEKSQNSQGGKDYWLVKISATGTKLWDKRFGGSNNDELRASTSALDGGYVLAGQSFSGASGDKTQSNQGGSDYWVVQVDKDGNKVSDERYGGSGTEELRTVFKTADGGLLLGGRSDSGVSGDRSQPSQGSTDYWLVKVAPETTPMLAARAATLAEEPARVETVSMNAYPNPFAERATVSFTLPETQTATVKVYDSQGREVATLFQGEAKANQVYQVEWKANNKAAGMYLLQLQTPTTRRQHKLLLAK